MSRLAPAPEVEECLLCGAACEPFWHPERREVVVYDLCPRCAGVVQATADRVAARVVAELAGPVHVPGQLQLQDPACQWAHGAAAELDSRGLCPVCAADMDECNACQSDGPHACPEHRP